MQRSALLSFFCFVLINLVNLTDMMNESVLLRIIFLQSFT